jgi:hypothetical protein
MDSHILLILANFLIYLGLESRHLRIELLFLMFLLLFFADPGLLVDGKQSIHVSRLNVPDACTRI